MAKLGIFTGTSPNDTTGDTLSQGAVKINSNFSEIYTALGDGTNITNSLTSITVAGLSTFTNGPILVGSGIQTGTSKLQVSGNTFITGSVGVGTTNPTSNLHIIGDGRFSGIVTAISFSGNSSSASYATTAGIATYSTNSGVSTSVIGGIGSITQLQVTGVSTFTNGPVLIGGGTSTGTSGQILQVTGISSGVYIGGSVGIGTTAPISKLHVVGNVQVDGTITGNFTGNLTNAIDAQNVKGGIGSITQLQVSGISTFTNGPVLVGSGIQTGASKLQVSGDTFITGSVGVGTTNPTSKLTVAGQFQSTGAGSTLTGGGQIYLNGSGGNRIDFHTNGVAAPTTTTRSVGTKIVLYPSLAASGVDYAFGVEDTAIWSSVYDSTHQFKWYAGTTPIATLTGDGNLGIGTTNPTSSLSVNGSTVIGTEILNMTGLSSTFTTVGSNTFTVPAGVTKISAVLIGGGGAGGGGSSGGSGAGGQGGGGGGLRYVNDFAVTPGQTLTVVVGAGGVGGTGNGGNGGDSSITGIATAFGGTGGLESNTGIPVGSGGSGSGGSGGATGGSGGTATLTTGAGGGGAAGYSGNGGTGGNGSVSNGGVAGSGGGAGGGAAPTASGSGGGGIGVLGQGTSGSLSNGAGNAGSGGSNGSTGNTTNGAAGGLYGGGGGGADGGGDGSPGGGGPFSGGNGAQGIVRIIWSPSSKFSRLFPTNQVGNNINQ